MSLEANKNVVRRYIEEVINAGNVGLIDELCGPGLRDQVRQVHSSLYQDFPDIREEILELVAEGETVMARWILRATQQAPFYGIPATGKPIEVTGFSVYNFRDGQIVRDAMAIDWLDAVEQLGGTIVPAG